VFVQRCIWILYGIITVLVSEKEYTAFMSISVTKLLQLIIPV